MKSLLKNFFLFSSIVLVSTACSSHSHLTVYSDKQINMQNFSVNTSKHGNYVEGKDKKQMIVVVPTGDALACLASEKAFQQTPSNLLVDTNLDYNWFYIPYIYGEYVWQVNGYEAR